ncbi:MULTISPECIES: glycosidase [Vibrio]|nr:MULTISPECIES: glycosidase [Vibrio harveyi group]BDP36859.1 glycosidase [Vibrio alginolyticus]MCR9651248.1 glycosidase [Vibrio parahaemolyticus]MCR9662611.1 glycosidase [Vibrio parahaemolyticus]MCR9677080.1 glycosidase [Vibrio parahaemolyticus]MCR9806000.1 glycosidase [Vibrio parahaemolyticus]
MKKLIINTACTLAAVSILSACSSTSSENTTQDEVHNAVAFTSTQIDMMTNCSLPDSAESGPLSKDIFVVGSFPNADWKHTAERKLTYKGNNVYQVIADEVSGNYKMQYAAEQWKPQFTAKGKKLSVGQLNELTYGGYGTDTKLEIKEPGKYLWSLEFKDDGSPYSIMVNKCQ